MRANLAVDAIAAALRTGLVADNAIMHTDRGGQYHSKVYRSTLRRPGIQQSTSRTGSCFDGAAVESFFATIKTEIGADSWPDRASARRDIENLDHALQRAAPALFARLPDSCRVAHRLATAHIKDGIEQGGMK